MREVGVQIGNPEWKVCSTKKPARKLMTEPFPANRAVYSKKVSFTLSSFAGLFQVAGAILLLIGVYLLSFIPIAVGIMLGILGLSLRSNLGREGKRIAFEDPLAVQDNSLQIVGDEIRSTNGYSVRKIEDGVQYVEGDHALTLQNDSAPLPDDEPSLQELVAQETLGADIHASDEIVNVSPQTAVRWDSPHEDEPIPPGRLVQILLRIVQAVKFYESKGARSNRLLQ